LFRAVQANVTDIIHPNNTSQDFKLPAADECEVQILVAIEQFKNAIRLPREPNVGGPWPQGY
jgi:hypothetical protein